MRLEFREPAIILGTLLALAVPSAFAVDLVVVSTQPPRHTVVPRVTPISVSFDRAVDPSSVDTDSFSAFGSRSGPTGGTFSFSNGNQTVTLNPEHSFLAGETVTVLLSRPLQAADAGLFRATGYAFQFVIRARPAPNSYTLIATLTNRTPEEIMNGEPTRIYGAAATDLNHDGFPDLTTVNEDSDDLRVLMHTTNPVTPFNTFLPPFEISHEASPNETADLNRDGNTDIAVAASSTSSAWFVLGAGDGTYATGQERNVGFEPHGIALLDVDGDGDLDAVTSNTSANNLSLMLNNGSGTFGVASPFDAGCNGEYGIHAADMNNDGIMDLVIGCRFSEDIRILRGNGNGTFTQMTLQDAGGLAWMVVCADVNGDGNMDVTVANSQSNNAGILLGNGAFGLSLPSIVPMPGHTVATDLGDMDGDGDLDLILASFGAGVWRLFTNNGAGVFTFHQEFTALNNPSCAIVLDFDKDGDLDLAHTDEIADVIKLLRNGGINPMGDFDNDLDVDSADYTSFAGCFSGPGGSSSQACIPADFDGDGDVDCGDWISFGFAWTAGGQPPELPQCSSIEVPALTGRSVLICGFLIFMVSIGLFRAKSRVVSLKNS